MCYLIMKKNEVNEEVKDKDYLIKGIEIPVPNK
jgi:hypothetical protein